MPAGFPIRLLVRLFAPLITSTSVSATCILPSIFIVWGEPGIMTTVGERFDRFCRVRVWCETPGSARVCKTRRSGHHKTLPVTRPSHNQQVSCATTRAGLGRRFVMAGNWRLANEGDLLCLPPDPRPTTAIIDVRQQYPSSGLDPRSAARLRPREQCKQVFYTRGSPLPRVPCGNRKDVF